LIRRRLEEPTLYFRFGVALVVGMLIGLQREYAFDVRDKELFAGMRTFALMAVTGCAAAMISDLMRSPLPFLGILLVVGGLLTISHYVDALKGAVGLTTDVAVLLTVVTGGLVYWGEVLLAVAIGVATAVLLSIKVEAQRFVKHLNQEDIVAALQFAVITAIILPLVPNETFGPPPFDVLNPFTIWLLVVLISGISFIGYVLNKVLGASRGIGLTGLVGGLASSTAVTLTFAQRSREAGKLAKPMALGITLASTVMFVRVFVEAAVVNPALVGMLWIPIAASIVAGLAYSLFLYLSQRSQPEEDIKLSNPFDLGMAIKFGLAFTVIFLIARAAQIYFGDAGIYVSSVLSGLVGVDAIVLSLAELSRGPASIDPSTAVRAIDSATAVRGIILAAVANTAAKGAIVLAAGTSELRRYILPGFILMMLTGLILMLILI
jgi:uncharacterized membrane protein (DUF4010 family)